MGMSVGPVEEEMSAKADINTTPLVDVMLVMLIIFLVTIPVINKTVKVDLPKAANIPTVTKPENITIAIDRNGNIYWNEGLVPDRTRLQDLVVSAARQNPQPEIHIRGDAQTRYEAVGRVMYAIQRGGVVKVGFITEPDRGIRGER
jgi:biopolymer transport protein ExbD